jgi:hypothetical protein
LNTSRSEALEFDANSYFELAKQLVQNNSIISNFFDPNAKFIDQGYPTFLALLMTIIGEQQIIVFQIANYFLWLLAATMIFLALNLIQPGKVINYLIFISPLYASFSPKIYSEPLAAFGLSLIIYSLVCVYQKRSNSFSLLALFVGQIFLFTSKSMFLYLFPLIVLYLLIKKSRLLIFVSFVSFLIIVPRVISSSQGGRGEFNLAIQTAKTQLSMDQILACSLYHLSYPIGQKILPQYQGICHQNDPTPQMPGYSQNPYLVASTTPSDSKGLYALINLVLRQPTKFVLIATTSLFNFIFFEGLYPSTTLLLPTQLQPLVWLIFKATFSLFMWILFIAGSIRILKTKSLDLFFITILPSLAFAGTVIFFPVEQRYIYPLIPLIYFTASLYRFK